MNGAVKPLWLSLRDKGSNSDYYYIPALLASSECSAHMHALIRIRHYLKHGQVQTIVKPGCFCF